MTNRDNRTSRNRPEHGPAKTDEPFTEQLFGRKGVRVIHFITYALVFGLVTSVCNLIFAIIRTISLVLLNVVGLAKDLLGSEHPLATADATVTTLFKESLLDLHVFTAASFVSIVVTCAIYYWNEIRYKRGEWVRTFL